MHLLKQGSKKIVTDRKRRKVQLMGSFADYQSSKKKPYQLNIGQLKQPQQPQPAMAPMPSAQGSIQQALNFSNSSDQNE